MLGNASLTQRMTITVVLILIVAATLTATLNILKFERVVADREAAIYGFEVSDIKRVVEDSMNLGLALNMLRNTQALIDRRNAEDPVIQSISVYDEQRRVLFDTDRQRIGEPLDRRWQALAPDQAAWAGRTPDTAFTGAPLVNSFGKSVGGIVLRYDPNRINQTVTGVLLEVTVATLEVTLLACVIAVAGVWWLIRDARYRLQAMGSGLAALADENQPSARLPAAADDEPGFTRAARETLHRLRRAERLIERIGLRK